MPLHCDPNASQTPDGDRRRGSGRSRCSWSAAAARRDDLALVDPLIARGRWGRGSCSSPARSPTAGCRTSRRRNRGGTARRSRRCRAQIDVAPGTLASAQLGMAAKTWPAVTPVSQVVRRPDRDAGAGREEVVGIALLDDPRVGDPGDLPRVALRRRRRPPGPPLATQVTMPAPTWSRRPSSSSSRKASAFVRVT